MLLDWLLMRGNKCHHYWNNKVLDTYSMTKDWALLSLCWSCGNVVSTTRMEHIWTLLFFTNFKHLWATIFEGWNCIDGLSEAAESGELGDSNISTIEQRLVGSYWREWDINFVGEEDGNLEDYSSTIYSTKVNWQNYLSVLKSSERSEKIDISHSLLKPIQQLLNWVSKRVLTTLPRYFY